MAVPIKATVWRLRKEGCKSLLQRGSVCVLNLARKVGFTPTSLPLGVGWIPVLKLLVFKDLAAQLVLSPRGRETFAAEAGALTDMASPVVAPSLVGSEISNSPHWDETDATEIAGIDDITIFDAT